MDVHAGAKPKTRKKTSKVLVIFSIAAVFLAAILTFYHLPRKYDVLGVRSVLKGVEDLSLNWRFASRTIASQATAMSVGIKRSESAGIFRKMIIAAVDDQTIQYFKSYPLDRSVWANMMTNFNAKDPVPDVVLFDMFFSGPGAKPESDKAMIRAFDRYRGTVGNDFALYPVPGIDLDGVKRTDDFSGKQLKLLAKEGSDYNSREIQAMRKFELDLPENLPGVRSFAKILPVMPELAETLTYAGSVNMDSEDDKQELYRRLPMITRMYYYVRDKDGSLSAKSVFYPSAALASVAEILGADLKKMRVEPGAVILTDARQGGTPAEFRIPVDENYRLAVNYKANPGTGYIRVIPVRDIFRAGLPRNAVVLVGVYVQGTAANNWNSPLGSMFSVEHIGYAIGTMLNRDFITTAPVWLNVLYVVLFTLLVGFLVSRGIRTMIAAFVISIAVPFAVGFALFQFNFEILTMVPVVTALLVLIAGEIYILLTEEKEKRFIKSTFSKYVNPDLVNILIQNPDMIQLGGQDVDATILFSDIRGFTTLSEGMTPNELISFLNIYLSRMTDIVMETQGTLDKYIGDAVVAFWGTPMKLPNHALNGCRAAVRMMQELRKFNEEMAAQGKKPINIGVGLNSGSITVGNIGSDKKKNYTAIGENTQLAEDLQDENKVYGTNVIISEMTYNLVKDQVVVRELDTISVKGHDKPVRIYELLDVK